MPFFGGKKQNIVVQINYKCAEEDAKAWAADVSETHEIIYGWFPKYVEIKVDHREWSFIDRNVMFDIVVGDTLVFTNTWMDEGFFAQAKDTKKDFVKQCIEDAISGKKPDVTQFKKDLKAARAHKEKVALDEANEKSVEMKKLRLENEEKARQEKARKLKEIKDREEAAEKEKEKAAKEKTKEAPKAKPKKAVAKKAVAKASSETAPPNTKAGETEKPEAGQGEQQHEPVAPKEEEPAANEKTEDKPEAATCTEEASGVVKEDAAAGQPMKEDAAADQHATGNDSMEAEPVRPTETAIVEAAGAVNSQNGNTEVDTAVTKVDPVAAIIRQVSQNDGAAAAVTNDGSMNLKDLMYMMGFACCKPSKIAPDSLGDCPTMAVQDKSFNP